MRALGDRDHGERLAHVGTEGVVGEHGNGRRAAVFSDRLLSLLATGLSLTGVTVTLTVAVARAAVAVADRVGEAVGAEEVGGRRVADAGGA